MDSLQCGKQAYKVVKINPSLYPLCFTGTAKQGVRCGHCLSSTHKLEECTLAEDNHPDLGKQIKAVESAVLALATNRRYQAKTTIKTPRDMCTTRGGAGSVSAATGPKWGVGRYSIVGPLSRGYGIGATLI